MIPESRTIMGLPSRVWLVMLGAFLLILTMPTASLAQMAQADFEVDVVSVRSESPGMTRVDLYAKVPITQISFINTPNGFSGGYEVKMDAIQLSDDNRLRNLTQSKIWDASRPF